jgi:hypothetical protein
MGGFIMDVNFWKDYRKTTGLLTWRLATEADQPVIDKIRETTARMLKEKQKELSLFRSPVILTLVAETMLGDIVDVLYVEAQVEIIKIGVSETGFIETAGIADDLNEYLRGIGFRTTTIKTRKSLKDAMSVMLEYLGFNCEDSAFPRWTREL